MIFIATMKATRHEILKEEWRVKIREHRESGLTVKQWCEENSIKPSQYYYWLRVIRQESLIQAGTLAVTGQARFAELRQVRDEPCFNNAHGICAILRSNGDEIEILNGADPNTLEAILEILKKS